MSKKILTLLLSVAVLATTACMGTSSKSDKNNAPIKQIVADGTYTGTITLNNTPNIYTDAAEMKVTGLSLILQETPNNPNEHTFKFIGQFNEKIATNESQQSKDICFSGTWHESTTAENLRTEFTNCVFANSQFKAQYKVYGADDLKNTVIIYGEIDIKS